MTPQEDYIFSLKGLAEVLAAYATQQQSSIDSYSKDNDKITSSYEARLKMNKVHIRVHTAILNSINAEMDLIAEELNQLEDAQNE